MKTYVLCTTLEQHSIDTLKKIKDSFDMSNVILHIVTIIEVKMYNNDLIPFIYPIQGQYEQLSDAAETIMRSLAKQLEVKEENIVIKCLFDSDYKNKTKEYLEEVEADLVVTATRGKHGIEGFFSSSFTDYLCKFSPCDVLVLRP